MNIKEERKKLKIKQYQMARVVGLATENYNKVENGKAQWTEWRYNLACQFIVEYKKLSEDLENLIQSYEKKSIDIKKKQI